jgi:transposase
MPRPRRRSLQPAAPPVVNPHAAGIDIGATTIYVCVPLERDPEPIRHFGTFTEDLHTVATWLERCGVTSVAMESTGVYWIPLYQILEARGLEVCLVNARHVKHVPGRKTDVQDCQWLQYLHSVGLLRASFRPPEAVCAVRSLLRHRDMLVQLAATHTQHMQKALTQMNLQLHHVLSDVTGVTGLAILDAIVAGERDPQALAAHRDPRVKAPPETIAKALVGDYRVEHLFTLRQALESYRHYQRLLGECDAQIAALLADFTSTIDPGAPPLPPPSRKTHRHAPQFDLRGELYRILGTDLTAVPGFATSPLTLFAELGPHLAKFPSAKAFASWLGLCPDNRISGGKVLSVKTRHVIHRVATALRLAAQSLQRSRSALGAYYRRMRARLGAPKAITATAHKLARILYHLLTTREAYEETRVAAAEAHYQRRSASRLRAHARALGYQLVPLIPEATEASHP